MKKVFNLALLFAMASSVLFVGCKDKDEDGGSTIEARIKTIQITNGGLSGGELYDGVIDETAKTITFDNVAAETNIAAVKFKTSVSLGAKLDADSYDFTNAADPTATVLTQTITVTNKDVTAVYTVTLNLAAPANAPILEKLVIVDDQNVEKTLTNVNIIEGIILLGFPEAAYVTVKEVVVAPARAEYTFTTAQEGKILKDNPGKLELSFMGLETKYDISFGTAPKAGADFTQAKVHDFSVATENVYPLYPGELVRGADFDGKYVLIVDRAAPEVHTIENLLNDVVSPIKLNTTGIEGGTHIISSGKLAQGHIYLCNLPASGVSTVTGNGPLKVYHYATPESTPEVILEWAGTIGNDTVYKGRLGDNISVNLDESGNGYIYFVKNQEDADRLYRFTVANFNEVTVDPVEIALPAIAPYYGFYNQIGENQYLFTSSYVPMLWLLDKDGTKLAEIEMTTTTAGERLAHGVDPHILEFNRARYLFFTVSNNQNMHWNFGPVFYLLDITEGNDVVAALAKLSESLWPEDDETPTCEPAYKYFLDPTGATASTASVAHANAAEVDGKLVIFTSAANAGFAIIEVPRAQ